MRARSEQRDFYARQFVIDTYDILNVIGKEKFDICFDSSRISVQDTILATQQSQLLKEKKWKILLSSSPELDENKTSVASRFTT